jgi:hypothetical protein
MAARLGAACDSAEAATLRTGLLVFLLRSTFEATLATAVLADIMIFISPFSLLPST